MSKLKKVLLDGLLFIGIFLLTIYGIFHGENLAEVRDNIADCRIEWLVPALFCVVLFIGGEAMILRYLFRSCGVYLKKRHCFLFSSIGFFFSCVTPSASGGQPMQLYFMRKHNIPVATAAVVLMIVTITYKLVLVVVGVGMLLFGREFLLQHAGGRMALVILGMFLNIGSITIMCILIFWQGLARKLALGGIRLLEKLHILKKSEERIAWVEQTMETYHTSAAYLKTHMHLWVRCFLITVVQRCSMFSVTYLVYRSFSLKGTGYPIIVMLQALISVCADMLPLPGGMGISESLFLSFFDQIFGEEYLLPGLLLSRGLSYYSELLLTAVLTMVAVFVFAETHRRVLPVRRKKM